MQVGGKGRGWMIKLWITLGKQADLFAVCVAWQEHCARSFYQQLMEISKDV